MTKGSGAIRDLRNKNATLTLSGRKALTGFLFALPCIFGLSIFFLYPLLNSLYLSFCNINTELEPVWIGLEKYRIATTVEITFNQQLVTSLREMSQQVPIIVMFSFFAATLLNQKFHGNKVARVIFLMPIIMASYTIMNLDAWDPFQTGMRNANYRQIESVSNAMQNFNLRDFLTLYSGLPDQLIGIVNGAVSGVYGLVRMSGIQTLVLFTALQSVSPSLFEAADVEGATGWEKFWLITFPMISPMLILCVIYSIIDSFTAFNNWILLYIQRVAFQAPHYDLGLSAAMSWIYFAIIVTIIGLVMLLLSKRVFYYDK